MHKKVHGDPIGILASLRAVCIHRLVFYLDLRANIPFTLKWEWGELLQRNVNKSMESSRRFKLLRDIHFLLALEFNKSLNNEIRLFSISEFTYFY